MKFLQTLCFFLIINFALSTLTSKEVQIRKINELEDQTDSFQPLFLQTESLINENEGNKEDDQEDANEEEEFDENLTNNEENNKNDKEDDKKENYNKDSNEENANDEDESDDNEHENENEDNIDFRISNIE